MVGFWAFLGVGLVWLILSTSKERFNALYYFFSVPQSEMTHLLVFWASSSLQVTCSAGIAWCNVPIKLGSFFLHLLLLHLILKPFRGIPSRHTSLKVLKSNFTMKKRMVVSIHRHLVWDKSWNHVVQLCAACWCSKGNNFNPFNLSDTSNKSCPAPEKTSEEKSS